MRLWLVLPTLAGLVACDDTTFTSGSGGGTPVSADWCGVKQIFADECVACHGGASPSAGFSLEGDPYDLLMTEYVKPGDKAGSLIYQKVSGTQSSGGVMPPGGPVVNVRDAIGAWIDAGATKECSGDTGDTGDSGDTADTSVPDPGWCAVMSAVNTEGSCLNCHSGKDASAGLDLNDNPYDKLVGQPSGLYAGRTFVVPYYPDASLLYRKLTDTLRADEGVPMPMGGELLTQETRDMVHAWIRAGALPETCE